jgi:hypothetical protein
VLVSLKYCSMASHHHLILTDLIIQGSMRYVSSYCDAKPVAAEMVVLLRMLVTTEEGGEYAGDANIPGPMRVLGVIATQLTMSPGGRP